MTTVLAASGLALLVLLSGSVPWTLLSAWNQRAGLLVPWSLVPMAIYLWAYFRFLDGGWTASGSEDRRANLQANRLPASCWLIALPAGLLGIGTVLALLVVISRLIHLPEGSPITAPAGMPAPTMFALLAMQSSVAGVTEESAFRGYMQSIVSRRFGVVVAVIAGGVLFGLLHFPNHPSEVVAMLPDYIAVSVMYGGLTWATGSILPAVVLHSVGDIVVLTRWWLTGRPEWQLSTIAPPLVWERGFDAAFAAAVVATAALGIATAWAYAAVHQRTTGDMLSRRG